MAIHTKFLGLVDVILRVPPLFIIDELLRTGLGIPQTEISEGNDDYVEEHLQDEDAVFYQSQMLTALAVTILKFFLSCLGCVSALCVFMLWTKHLVSVYLYLMSVGIVFVSYWTNVSTIKAAVSATTITDEEGSFVEAHNSPLEDILSLNLGQLVNTDSFGFTVIQNYILQCILAFTFCYVHLGPRYPLLQRILPISFMAPSFLALLPLPPAVIQHAPVFSALLPLALVKFVLWCSTINVVRTVYGGYQYARTFVSNFGLSTLVETEWARLNVPCVLRTFWMLRVIEHAVVLLAKSGGVGEDPELAGSGPWVVAAAAKSLLISGCETTTAVLGMTSAVSYVCHYVGCFFQWALQAEDDEEKSIGTVSAILFYILALQTGLTGLEPEKRFVRLCRNVCLLFTALLHFVHNIVNPLLMSLSASHNHSLRRHARALAVCAFLILFPASLLAYLWSHHPTSTWLLAVSAFSVEVIVKVWVSLAIYSLFLVDACRSTFWEKLDDYVYYIRAFGNTVEFCFGIFLFFNGAWILVFESGGTIRAIMMCIHAYFNIWCEAKAGWSVFMKRRTAVRKIESLPEASEAQLQELDDVCAICYQEMQSAKITRCWHFFHGVCLRKWLYMQDRCPLCHDILYWIDSGSDNKDDDHSGESPGEEPRMPFEDELELENDGGD